MINILSYELDINAHVFDFKNKESNIDIITRYDMAQLQAMFEYKNLPETIPKRMLEMFLQSNGNIFITNKYNGKDLYAYTGGLGGVRDEYYRPTIYTIANPFQEFTAELRVDVDGVLMRNDSMASSLIPLLSKYNTLLLETELTMYIADINIRLTEMLSSTDESTKRACDKYLKDIIDGKLGTILDESLVSSITKYNDKQSHGNVTQLIELYQFIKGTKAGLLGMSSTVNMKRERLNSGEVELDSDLLLPYIDDMLQSRREGLRKVNEMYGTDISVDLASAWGVRHTADMHLAESAPNSLEPNPSETGESETELTDLEPNPTETSETAPTDTIDEPDTSESEESEESEDMEENE